MAWWRKCMDNKTGRFPLQVIDCFFLLRIALLAPVWTILLVGWITGSAGLRPFLWFSHTGKTNPGQFYVWAALGGFSLIVASIYVVNQIVDIESDRINHKLFLLPHNYISIRTAWILAVTCALGGMACSLFFDAVMTCLFAMALILGALYNLPPFTLKNRAWGGVFANILGHGVLTFLVGWYCANFQNGNGWGALRAGLIPSLSPGMANAAVFLATTIPDAAGDAMTGKLTFCVKFGKKRTSLAAALFCGASFFLSPFMGHNFWVMGAPALLSLVLFIALAATEKLEAAFYAFKWPVFLLTVFVIVFVWQYGLLVLATFFGSRIYYNWRFGIEYPTFKTK